MNKWEEVKDPSDQNFYEVYVSKEWLGGAEISSATFDVPVASGLVFSPAYMLGNLIRAYVTDGVPGEWQIDVTITSGIRVKQRKILLTVAER